MRKIIFTLAGIALLTLTAARCGNKQAETTNDTVPTDSTEVVDEDTIGMNDMLEDAAYIQQVMMNSDDAATSLKEDVEKAAVEIHQIVKASKDSAKK